MMMMMTMLMMMMMLIIPTYSENDDDDETSLALKIASVVHAKPHEVGERQCNLGQVDESEGDEGDWCW